MNTTGHESSGAQKSASENVVLQVPYCMIVLPPLINRTPPPSDPPIPTTLLGGGQRPPPRRVRLEGSCSILECVLKEFEGPGGGPRVGGVRVIKGAPRGVRLIMHLEH